MNKFFNLLIVFVLFAFTSTGYSQVNDLESLSKCLVKIQVNKTDELKIDSAGIIEDDYSLGTGFYISENGLIITAAHVIRKRNLTTAASILCYDDNSNESFVPIIVFEDIKNDIAVLQNAKYTGYGKTNIFFINIKKTSFTSEKIGSKVYSFGFPNELQRVYRICAFSTGRIISFNTNLDGYKKLTERANVSLADCPVISGFSGGIVTDTSFQPLGLILGSIIEKNKRITYFKSLSFISKILEANEIQ